MRCVNLQLSATVARAAATMLPTPLLQQQHRRRHHRQQKKVSSTKRMESNRINELYGETFCFGIVVIFTNTHKCPLSVQFMSLVVVVVVHHIWLI